jgi:hypothetical protein
MSGRNRKYFRLLLLLLIGAGVLPFLYPPGQPWLAWRELELPALPSLDMDMQIEIPQLPTLDDEGGKSEPLTVYRWRGEDGSWHFAATPPEGVTATPMRIDPNANLIRSLPDANVATGVAADRTEAADHEGGAWEFNYSAEEISELIGSARVARDALERHHAKQAEVLKQGE